MGVPKLSDMRKVSLDVSNIACECRVWDSRRDYHRIGGLIAFRGYYPPGSAGNNHARWIKWRLREFYELARFDGLVVDCRELEYIWGDDLDLRPRSSQLPDGYPFRLVILPEQQESFGLAEPRECHRFELSVALAEVNEQMHALRGR